MWVLQDMLWLASTEEKYFESFALLQKAFDLVTRSKPQTTGLGLAEQSIILGNMQARLRSYAGRASVSYYRKQGNMGGVFYVTSLRFA